MNDLFKKLNVLVKAGISDLLGEEQGTHRKSLTPAQLGKGIDGEIAALRQRIDDALAYEDVLQAKAKALAEEVARWDQQADEAVSAGRDAIARHAIDQMQNAQKRLAMAESDLHEHRLVTQELIQRVNTLEAVVADARRAQAEKQPAPEDEVTGRTPGQALSDVLRDARQKIAGMGDLISARQERDASPEQEPSDGQSVEEDLARRRERLSKPK